MQKPDLSFWKLWNLSFGFFGVQIAYALQSANISRIFATLGADPHSLSYFWIMPPLMGILVQPIVGAASDKTWTRFGRRIPYLIVGGLLAVLVMCVLPNAGSFGLAVSSVLILGLIALMFLDTTINMAMQPFKMMVGDMVNEEQKKTAYSLQSFFINVGSVVGFVFPFVFTMMGVRNTAEQGVVPPSVVWSFYIGAAIIVLCILFTVVKVKEWNPEEYAKYNGAPQAEEKTNFIKLLAAAPKAFWQVGLVQFFCWGAFMYMWSFVNGAVSETVWGTTDATTEAYQEASNWVGILYAVEAMGAVLWTFILQRIPGLKLGYAISLLFAGLGFALIPFVTPELCGGLEAAKYAQFVPFMLIGCGWSAMMAMPFTIVTNALQGYGHMGQYLGLFNGTICLPQIIAASLGGMILTLVGGSQPHMMIVAGLLLALGGVAVSLVKLKK